MTPKTVGILNVVFGGLGALASVAVAIDQIRNADKRAVLTGTSAGEAAVRVTAKELHRTLGGTLLDGE